jgi:hypothetical protein
MIDQFEDHFIICRSGRVGRRVAGERAAFLEILTSHDRPDLRFEEIEIASGYAQAGRTTRELQALENLSAPGASVGA